LRAYKKAGEVKPPLILLVVPRERLKKKATPELVKLRTAKKARELAISEEIIVRMAREAITGDEA
jgi:hypothetical protein